MGLEDKGRNVVIHHLGGAREQAGRLTGNGELQREGRVEQALAPFGKAAETAKDASAGVSGNFASAAQKLQGGLGKG